MPFESTDSQSHADDQKVVLVEYGVLRIPRQFGDPSVYGTKVHVSWDTMYANQSSASLAVWTDGGWQMVSFLLPTIVKGTSRDGKGLRAVVVRLVRMAEDVLAPTEVQGKQPRA